MSPPVETNSPLCVDHFCARCLESVAAEDQECPTCARNFSAPGETVD